MNIGFDAKRIFHNRTGLGNYGRDIIRILRDHMSDIELFLFDPKPTKRQYNISGENVSIESPGNWFWKSFPSLWRLMGQWKQIISLNIDCYHGLSGEIPIRLWGKTVPKIVTIHDLIFLSHPQFYRFFDRLIYRLKFRYAIKTADKVVAISEQTKRDIIKYFNTEPDKITVIYQGCNEAYKISYTEEEKQAVLTKFKLQRNYILNVGTLQERKNVLILLQAIRNTSLRLVLVGQEKSYAKELYNYIDQNNLSGQVTFIRDITVRELAMVYQQASIFCYPSLCEGFGIPIIEALYSKVPVVVTKNGCFPEAAGPDSYYIDPKNPEQIRNILLNLMEDEAKRKTMAEKGHRYVQRFADANVARELISLYKSLAS